MTGRDFDPKSAKRVECGSFDGLRSIFDVSSSENTPQKEEDSVTFHFADGGSKKFISGKRRLRKLRNKVVERVQVKGLCKWIIYDEYLHKGPSHTLPVGFDQKPNFEYIKSLKIVC